MLRGLGGGPVRGDFQSGQARLVLEVIDSKLNDHSRGNRRVDGRTVTKGMLGAPVLKSGLIDARGVVRGTFKKN
jgi:hypothetical protein